MQGSDCQVEKNECPWHWEIGHEGCWHFLSLSLSLNNKTNTKQKDKLPKSPFWPLKRLNRTGWSVKVCCCFLLSPQVVRDVIAVLLGIERLSASLIVSGDFQLTPDLNPMCHFQVLIMILMRGCFAWSPLSQNQWFSSWKEVLTVLFQSRQTAKGGEEHFKR